MRDNEIRHHDTPPPVPPRLTAAMDRCRVLSTERMSKSVATDGRRARARDGAPFSGRGPAGGGAGGL